MGGWSGGPGLIRRAVGAAGGHSRPEDSQEEMWVRPAPACTPSNPSPPTSLQTPRKKGSSRKGCADGERLAPGSECTQSPNRPGGEDATPDTDGRQGARGSPPRPGGSWVRELGSSQVRTVEQSPNNQWSLAPRLRRSPPPEPPVFQNEVGSSQKRLSSPQKSAQASTPPLPSRHPARRGEPCRGGASGGCRGLSLLPPKAPRVGKARWPSSPAWGLGRAGNRSSGSRSLRVPGHPQMPSVPSRPKKLHAQPPGLSRETLTVGLGRA